MYIDVLLYYYNKNIHNANINVPGLGLSDSPSLKSCIRQAVCYLVNNNKIYISSLVPNLYSNNFFAMIKMK